MMLNTLGFLDNAENRLGEARKEVSEALKIYRDLAQKDPESYLAHVAITLNNLGVFDKDQNQLNEARKEYEEALKIYHELAEKEPETYLSYVAATLNNLGILDRAQNQLEEARKAFKEALNIYESLAKQDPDQFSPLVEQMKKLLKHLRGSGVSALPRFQIRRSGQRMITEGHFTELWQKGRTRSSAGPMPQDPKRV